MSNPLVSVIIPAYNREKYVLEALRSVFDQTYRPLEIICVDDGSTDGTHAALSSAGNKITLIKNEKNLGIAGARNAGIKQAHGTYYAFLDSDDTWSNQKIEKQMKALSDDPALDAVFCMMQCFVSPDLSEEEKNKRYCQEDPMPGYTATTLLIRKEAFDKVGTFSSTFRIGEFVDWLSRANYLHIRTALLPETYCFRRIHDENIGIQQKASRTEYLKVAREAIKRRRNSPNA